jgi:hypothetical protein
MRAMVRRLIHTVLAVIFVLAVTLPGSVRAMPMPANMGGAGMQQQCPSCPEPMRTSPSPDKMPACQILACAGTVAALPSPVLLPARILLRSTYLAANPAHWTAVARTPDPFPPRPIALV